MYNNQIRMTYVMKKKLNFILWGSNFSHLQEHVMDCISDPENCIIDKLWER